MAFVGLLGLDESRAFGLTNPPPNSSEQPEHSRLELEDLRLNLARDAFVRNLDGLETLEREWVAVILVRMVAHDGTAVRLVEDFRRHPGRDAEE